MAKKDKATKLPKKVGGVKVPKQLRKTAQSALEIAQNPIARELVSAAMVAGAAALTKRSSRKAPSAAQPEASSRDTDIGAIIAQSVAAFVSGFDKGAEMMAEKIAPKSKPDDKP